MPTVSVIIPTYNRKEYLQEAIDSVLRQSYEDYEVIVVDDGSDDGTDEILNKRYKNRIRYVWQENKGESAARNAAIKISKGKYIAFLDSDDLWHPDKILRQVQVLENNPSIGLTNSQVCWITQSSKARSVSNQYSTISKDQLNIEKLILHNPLPTSAVMLRRSLGTANLLFDERIRYGEDWDLWLRLTDITDFHVEDLPMTYLRVHSENQSYFPKLEKVKQTLSDHSLILDKARKLSGVTQQLYNQALAQQYAGAAFASYIWSELDDGQRYLSTAMTLDRTTWTNQAHLHREIVRFGVMLLESGNMTDSHHVEHYVSGLATNWPADHPVSTEFLNRAKSEIFAAGAYRYSQLNDRKKTREFTLRTIRSDRKSLRNRGLVKRLLQSFS